MDDALWAKVYITCGTSAPFCLKISMMYLRGGGAQHIRVEHIHVNDEGKAIIGTVAAYQKQE